MRALPLLSLLIGLLILAGPPSLAAADVLQEVRARGELIVGVKDSTPPFGFIREGSRSIVGYDVDIAAAIARGLGVKLRLSPVTSATRIPELEQGHIDLIAATMTHTREREQQIDFSLTYFVTGQRVMTKRTGGIKALPELGGKKVSSVRGSTSEQNIRQAVASTVVIAFNDYPSAFLALAQGKVLAMTTDETILLGLQRKAPRPDDFVLLDGYISTEPYGLGIRKGEETLRREVNRILLELEASGEAGRIFNTWFGPGTEVPLKRTFRLETGGVPIR